MDRELDYTIEELLEDLATTITSQIQPDELCSIDLAQRAGISDRQARDMLYAKWKRGELMRRWAKLNGQRVRAYKPV